MKQPPEKKQRLKHLLLGFIPPHWQAAAASLRVNPLKHLQVLKAQAKLPSHCPQRNPPHLSVTRYHQMMIAFQMLSFCEAESFCGALFYC